MMLLAQICEHGKLTVSEGKKTGKCRACDKLVSRETFSVPNMTPFFNRGLGMVTNGTRDAEKKAKARGLTPLGDAKMSDVYKPKKDDSVNRIIEQGRKELHNLGSI